MDSKLKRRIASNAGYWVFVGPGLFFVLFISVVPLLMNFYNSLFDWNGITSKRVFVGLQNFITIFTKDAKFKTAVVFTSRYMVFYVVLVNTISLSIALVLSNSRRLFTNIGRSFYYIPCIISLTAIGLMWRFIFSFGMDTLYAYTGFAPFSWNWMSTPTLAFYSIVIIGVWNSVGFYNIIYIAGLLSVPLDAMEAATIDGAKGWQRFWRVTFPLIMPTFSTCLLLTLINGLKLFDTIYVFTNGGPAGTTHSIAFNIYSTAFTQNYYGMATAKSLLFFFALIVLTLAEFRLTRSEVNSI
ncbi:MAG: sugar ABC transporter permease [Clostridia bacterium]|nr:sugar ABC transporter permease [Clostridia bacterium]